MIPKRIREASSHYRHDDINNLRHHDPSRRNCFCRYCGHQHKEVRKAQPFFFPFVVMFFLLRCYLYVDMLTLCQDVHTTNIPT